MWAIRFTLFGLFVALDFLCILLLKHRERYEQVLESKWFNGLLLPTYYSLCLLVFLLPPESGWEGRPAWLQATSVRIGFPVMGLLLIAAGAILALATLRQRKVIGAQDVPQGLLTTGLYAHFRHPIWAGVLWFMLGLPLLARNPDGLLVYPLFFLYTWIGTIFEEKADMRRRFPEEYAQYADTTRMFGPLWVWSVLSLVLCGIAGMGLLAVDQQGPNVELTAPLQLVKRRRATAHTRLARLAEPEPHDANQSKRRT